MNKKSEPKYCRQPSANFDRAFVDFNGVRHYLGVYDSPESRQKYHLLLAERAVTGKLPPAPPPDLLTISELAHRFWEHAKVYYVKPDGSQTSEVSCFKQVLKPLKEFYGSKPVPEFGPLALKAVRHHMIQMNWVRGNINKQIGRLKMIFRWGVAEELVDPAVYQKLIAVPGLKRGRCAAKESMPVKPVPELYIEAIQPHVSPQVWALVQLQLSTAARSGELVTMRAGQLNRSGKVWTYSPAEHKTAHHDHERTIYIGPRGQEMLAPFLLGRDSEEYLFSAEAAELKRRQEIHARRKTPLSCGNSPGTNIVASPERKPGDHYTRDSYRRAIQRACVKAGVPTWHPHQLRHNAATIIRLQFGLEAAQLLLGHTRADMTQVYAEVNDSKALQVAEKFG